MSDTPASAGTPVAPETTTSSVALERQIHRQPDELERLLDEPLPGDALERLGAAGRIWLIGTGTSQHAAELGAWMLQRAGRSAHAMSSMHFVHWGPRLDPADAAIVISHNAGTETAYAGAAWTATTAAGLAVVPITRRGGGLPEAIPTIEKEPSHTYSASYTAVLLVLARLAHGLGATEFDPATISKVPEAVRRAIASPGSDTIIPPPRLLVLTGEGPGSVTAREGAIKLREAARFPAEGYEVEYLLHGNAVPLSAEDHLVLLDPPDTDGLIAAMSETAVAEGVAVTRVRESSDLPPLLAQIPLTVRLQLLALRFARERGFDADVVIEGAWADEPLWAIGSPGPPA